MQYSQDAMADVKQRLQSAIGQRGQPFFEPIAADPWVISSLLQKSVRRGETEIAQRASLTLLNFRGSAIWRRFIVIAFEDVGIGSIDAITTAVVASSDAAFRKTCGGDVRVAAHLSTILADAPKDRSADFLAEAKDHPDLADFGLRMSNTRDHR